MATYKKDASKAGKLLPAPKSASVRSVAGSDLAQRKGGNGGKPVSKHATITQAQANSAVRQYLSKKK